MGEFRVHHVRFFEYNPSAIHCIAYESRTQKLAVSRSDGSIEIWSIPENWYHEKTIPPRPGQSVEGLLWCQGRLFSAGLHGNLQEYDLLTLTAKCHVSSNAGAIWCITTNEENTHIAAGTEDGCVVLFRVTEDGVQYERAFDKQEGRILSITWHSKEDRIISGGVDTIRIWSATSGHAVQRLTLGRTERNKETIVWSVAVTKDFTIVSGDSRGKTSFWNGRQGTLLKSYQSHKADVLALAVAEDGSSVFSSGVDPSLVQFEFIATERNSDWRTWVRSGVRYQHTHDVRTLTLTDKHIISGGVDTQLIYNLLQADQGIKKWHRLPSIPTTPAVQTAHAANIVLLKYPDYLELWRLGSTNRTSDKNGEVLSLWSNPVRLLQLRSKGEERIVSAAVSENAKWLAYSDPTSIRLFQVSLEEADLGVPKISVSRVRYLPPEVLPARCMAFTPGGDMLATATCQGSVQLLKLDPVKPQLLHTHAPRSDRAVGVHLLCMSPSGNYMATGDEGNKVHIYKLKNNKFACSLPEYKYKPTAISFSHSAPEVAVAYSDQKIVEYDFQQQEYTTWSRTLNSAWNRQWLKRQSKITRLFYHPTRHHQIFVHDDQMLCIIDKTQPLPGVKDRLFVKKLSTSEEDEKAPKHGFHICKKFKYLLGLDIMKEDFMLVVERPPTTLTESLPDVLRVKKFGT